MDDGLRTAEISVICGKRSLAAYPFNGPKKFKVRLTCKKRMMENG